LTTEYKHRYRELCKAETSIPVCQTDWWMDAACGEDNWDVFLVERGGRIVAAHPYFIRRRLFLKYITRPPLTDYNGVWIKYPEQHQKYEQRISYEREILKDIVNQIESLNLGLYKQYLHYSTTNLLPFIWRRFKTKLQYTYVVEDLSDMKSVCAGFRHAIRTEIKKAQKHVEVKEDCDIETAFSVIEKTFKRLKVTPSYTLEDVKSLDRACVEHSCRKVFCAQDEDERIHAVAYIVWDGHSAYYIMGGSDPELRNSGANSLVLYCAIQFASTVSKRFDFTGSTLEPLERFVSSFGGVQKPYFFVKKCSAFYLLAESLYKVSQKIRNPHYSW
jgi:hypothetical protein